MKVILIGIALIFLVWYAFAIVDYETHPTSYTTTELYLVREHASDGLWKAQNYNGIVWFADENVVSGNKIRVGDTVEITIPVSKRDPIVSLYSEGYAK